MYCVYDKYSDITIVKSYHRVAVSNHILGPNISKWVAQLHFNQMSILPYRTVLINTHLFKYAGSGLFHLSVHVSQEFKHYFWHNIIKGKLGSDMGQPGILTGDTRVSHTHPSGSYACGTPWYHQLVFLVVPHPHLVFL